MNNIEGLVEEEIIYTVKYIPTEFIEVEKMIPCEFIEYNGKYIPTKYEPVKKLIPTNHTVIKVPVYIPKDKNSK